AEAGCTGKRASTDHALPRQSRALQVSDLDRVPRSVRAHLDRQAAEVEDQGAVLGGPNPAGQLNLASGLLSVRRERALGMTAIDVTDERCGDVVAEQAL